MKEFFQDDVMLRQNTTFEAEIVHSKAIRYLSGWILLG